MTELALFAVELRRRRIEQKLTQEKVAEMLEISVRWYQKIEYGDAKPSFKLLCKIVKVMSIDLAEFCPKESEDYEYFIKNENR